MAKYSLKLGIGLQLTIAFSVGLALAIVFLGNISTRTVQEFGRFFIETTETRIAQQNNYYLQALTREQANRYQEIFNALAHTNSQVAYQAASYLENLDRYGQINLNPNEKYQFYEKQKMYSNSPKERVSALYWQTSSTTEREINALSHIDPLLETSVNNYSYIVGSWVLTKSAILRYYPNVPLVTILAPADKEDLRNGVFFTIAAPSNNPQRKTLWTPVYVDPAGQGLTISVTSPIYSRSGQFLGVAGTDISLKNIISEILSSENNSQSEVSFLIDRDGRIIALPLEKLSLLGISPTQDTLHTSQLVEYNLLKSTNTELQAHIQKMTTGKAAQTALKLQGKSYIFTYHPVAITGWSLGVLVPEQVLLQSIIETRNSLNTSISTINSRLALVTIFLVIGASVIILLISRQIVSPLIALTVELSRIQQVDSLKSLTSHSDEDASDQLIMELKSMHPENIATSTPELIDLRNAFIHLKSSLIQNWEKLGEKNSEIVRILQEYNQQLENQVIERTESLSRANAEICLLNEKLKRENLRMGAELDILKQMQQMILPKPEELEIEGLDIAGFMEPADEVGGDYYDVLQIDSVVTIGMGDVTGHGLESGILMLMTQTAVRTLKEVREYDPVRFLDTLNRTVYKNVQRMNSDKNLTLVVLNYAHGKVSISGQHEETLLVRNGGTIERIDTLDLGFPIGIDDSIADLISHITVELFPGDGIVLYTDGITEAINIHNEQYGIDRLCEVIHQNWHRSANEIKQSVIKSVKQHIGKQKVFDDITLLVFKQMPTEEAIPNNLVSSC